MDCRNLFVGSARVFIKSGVADHLLQKNL
jgi:hypothetical protein